MKKHIVVYYALCIIFLSTMTFASTPDYTYVNSFRTNITTGENNIGLIDFVKATYIPTNITVSTITNMSAQRYDQIQWTGGTSLQVLIPSGATVVMLPNDKLSLSQVGNYLLLLPSNNSVNATLSVTNESFASITIKNSDTPLTFTYTSTFNLTTDDVPILFKVTANSGLASGNYPVQFNFSSGYRNYTLDTVFVLGQNVSWTVLEDTLSSTVNAQSNSFNSIGYIKLQSNGNADTTINSKVTGNASVFLLLQPSQLLYKGAQTYFNVQLQVPNNQPDGVFSATINLSNGIKSYEKVVTVTVKDTTPPTIDNISFSHEEMGVDTIAQVIAKDNIGVVYVTIDGNGELTNMTKDQQLFTKQYAITQKSVNTFTVCAYDSSNNKACDSITKQFALMDLIKTNASVQIPSKKSNSFASKVFMNVNSTRPQNITVQLIDFFSDTTYNVSPLDKYLVQLQDSEGRVYNFATLNQTIALTVKGDVYVLVKGTNNSQYGMVLSVKVPTYAKGVEPITIRGKFQDYDSPKAFTKQIAGTNMTCVPTDTGSVEDSYQSCTLRLSILDDIENSAIVTTLREQKLIETKMQFILDDSERRVLYRNIGLSVLGAVSIMSLLYLFYVIRIYPRARFTK